MIFDFSTLSRSAIYHTMIQTIIPRPVAWVLSQNEEGSYNLAPFSYFTGISSNPPLLLFSAGKKREGEKKDTWHNIEERKHFVLHIPSRSMAGAVSETAAMLPRGVSEVEAGGLKTVPFGDDAFPLPRLEECPVAFACELYRIVEVGETPQAMILGRIRSLYLDESVAKESDGRLSVDAKAMDPLARLGGNLYASLGEIFPVDPP